jgi:hypothetical protein
MSFDLDVDALAADIENFKKKFTEIYNNCITSEDEYIKCVINTIAKIIDDDCLTKLRQNLCAIEIMCIVIQIVNEKLLIKLVESFWTRVINFTRGKNDMETVSILYMDLNEESEPYVGRLSANNYKSIEKISNYFSEWITDDLKLLTQFSLKSHGPNVALDACPAIKHNAKHATIATCMLILTRAISDRSFLSFFPVDVEINSLATLLQHVSFRTDIEDRLVTRLAHLICIVLVMNPYIMSDHIDMWNIDCKWLTVVTYFSLFHVLNSSEFNMIANANDKSVIPPIWLHLRATNKNNQQIFKNNMSWLNPTRTLFNMDRMLDAFWKIYTKDSKCIVLPDSFNSSTIDMKVKGNDGAVFLPLSLTSVIGLRYRDKNMFVLDVDDLIYGLFAFLDVANSSPKIEPMRFEFIKYLEGIACCWCISYIKNDAEMAKVNRTVMSSSIWYKNNKQRKMYNFVVKDANISAKIVTN